MLTRNSFVRCSFILICTNTLTIIRSHVCLFEPVLPGGSHAHVYSSSRDVGIMVAGGQRQGIPSGDEVEESRTGIQNSTDARTSSAGGGAGAGNGERVNRDV